MSGTIDKTLDSVISLLKEAHGNLIDVTPPFKITSSSAKELSSSYASLLLARDTFIKCVGKLKAKKSIREIIKSFDLTLNGLNSVLDEIQDNSVKKQTAKKLIAESQTEIRAISREINSQRPLIKNWKSSSEEAKASTFGTEGNLGKWMEKLRVAETQHEKKMIAKQEAEDKHDKEAVHVLQNTSVFKTERDSLKYKETPFEIFKFPVVPLTNPYLKPSVFKRLGFEVEEIRGYPVLMNQLIVALNTEYVDSRKNLRYEDIIKSKRVQRPYSYSKRPNSTKKEPYHPHPGHLKYMQDFILHVIQKHLSNKYVVVEYNVEVKSLQGWSFYWLMDYNAYHRLNKSGNVSIRIMRWEFPF